MVRPETEGKVQADGAAIDVSGVAGAVLTEGSALQLLPRLSWVTSNGPADSLLPFAQIHHSPLQAKKFP